ncbi:SCP2 sterol-binding domain-containing protein [Desulfosarcina sp. OttesenSCG-928-A07]|nr:SCP2 sterol-binding domain-containing protein [Desulfosarcina sp. OttesenSCG-928-G17]MDL2329657.1 SCP2 sterol-binding domain-containing protein [Desulfosarcina sp. OttesenSCG-928-A07]
MPLLMDAIGTSIGPLTKDYTWKDVVLYALGVGAGFSELDYCYEKDLKVIPSFALAMIFDFFSHATLASGATLSGVLHGEQEVIFHAPIPSEGTLTTTGTIVDYQDMGKNKGALIIIQSNTTHSNGTLLFTSTATLFSRFDGGFGGKPPERKAARIPNHAPNIVKDALPSPDQPLLYRLSGDIFQLHADPGFAVRVGFDRPIMHGLCTCGFSCRALIAALIPGQPDQARRLRCRFSAPLYPGIPIQTHIWQAEPGKALWRTVNVQTNDIIIDHGEFDYGPAPQDPSFQTSSDPSRTDDVSGSVKGVFNALSDAFIPSAAHGIQAVFQYIITDVGVWHCTIQDNACIVSEGRHDRPTCVFTIKGSDFLLLMTGKLSAIEAFIAGTLKVEGDLAMAQQSENWFKRG